MIHLEVPGIPPSSNHAYFNMAHGRVLTAVGKKYKTETKTLLARKYMRELRDFKPNEPYLIFIRMSFLNLQNETWGVKNGAQSRYKRHDVSNRAKLLEDVIKDVAGVDDSNTMTLILQKCVGKQELTDVFIWNTHREESPFDAPFSGL